MSTTPQQDTSRSVGGPAGPGGAVVTGAGGGLGRKIAGLLVQRGYQVLVTDVDKDAATAAAADLGERATARILDVSDSAEVQAACEDIVARAGNLRLWVNNAGVLMTGPAWEQDVDARRLMTHVNAIGAINGMLAAIDAMRTDGGHIVNIASLAGISPVPGEAVYAATKHAVIGFSLSTLFDLRLAGIKNIDISCVCPDGMWTPMLYDKLDDPASALSFSGKLLQPEDVIEAIATVLDKPRPIKSLPWWRGAFARFAETFPRLGLRALPLIVAQGRRTQRKLAESRGRQSG